MKEKSKLKKKADILFSSHIRKRDGHCLICKSKDNLNCAHILSRRHTLLRWDKNNAVCLCWSCHWRLMHHDPAKGMMWFQEKFPKRWAYLRQFKDMSGKCTELFIKEVIKKYSPKS
jgi:5-methylcytosine-specific restriction endonuclease McrA